LLTLRRDGPAAAKAPTVRYRHLLLSRFKASQCLLALLLIAPQGTAAAQAQDSLPGTGCWRVRYGRWSTSLGPNISIFTPLPNHLVLLATRDTAWTWYDAVRTPNKNPDPDPESGDTLPLRAFWRPHGTDSLDLALPIYWSAGMHATLHMTRDSLVGVLRTSTDSWPRGGPEIPIRAGRERCRGGT